MVPESVAVRWGRMNDGGCVVGRAPGAVAECLLFSGQSGGSSLSGWWPQGHCDVSH